MTKYELGAWVWGVLGAGVIAMGTAFIIKNFDSPRTIAPVLATLIATMGIVWSWFFQLSQREKHHADLIELEREKLKNHKGST